MGNVKKFEELLLNVKPIYTGKDFQGYFLDREVFFKLMDLINSLIENNVSLEFNKDLLWESDWNGYEVGYEDIEVVGLYKLKDTEIYFYIDMENNKMLEAWHMPEE